VHGAERVEGAEGQKDQSSLENVGLVGASH
jgi:hypothetical protein